MKKHTNLSWFKRKPKMPKKEPPEVVQERLAKKVSRITGYPYTHYLNLFRNPNFRKSFLEKNARGMARNEIAREAPFYTQEINYAHEYARFHHNLALHFDEMLKALKAPETKNAFLAGTIPVELKKAGRIARIEKIMPTFVNKFPSIATITTAAIVGPISRNLTQTIAQSLIAGSFGLIVRESAISHQKDRPPHFSTKSIQLFSKAHLCNLFKTAQKIAKSKKIPIEQIYSELIKAIELEIQKNEKAMQEIYLESFPDFYRERRE